MIHGGRIEFDVYEIILNRTSGFHSSSDIEFLMEFTLCLMNYAMGSKFYFFLPSFYFLK